MATSTARWSLGCNRDNATTNEKKTLFYIVREKEKNGIYFVFLLHYLYNVQNNLKLG